MFSSVNVPLKLWLVTCSISLIAPTNVPDDVLIFLWVLECFRYILRLPSSISQHVSWFLVCSDKVEDENVIFAFYESRVTMKTYFVIMAVLNLLSCTWSNSILFWNASSGDALGQNAFNCWRSRWSDQLISCSHEKFIGGGLHIPKRISWKPRS